MPSPDYYQILQITPDASLEQIKRAYRRLALVYHPDKNPGEEAARLFVAIREAYAVLGDAQKRKQYDTARFQETLNRTPIVRNVDELLILSNKIVSKMQLQDPFRIDKDRLFVELDFLVSAYHQHLMKASTDRQTIHQIMQNVFIGCEQLVYENALLITDRFKDLVIADLEAEQILLQFNQTARRRNLREKYTMPLVLVITLLICLLIYFAEH